MLIMFLAWSPSLWGMPYQLQSTGSFCHLHP